jgi:hypothetical protein
MPAVRARGPWFHRALIWFFSIVLTVLIYWTLGFLIDDAGEWSPPNYQAIIQAHIPRQVEQKSTELSAQAESLRQRASRVREQQSLLRQGTDNYQRTMQQMTELEKLRLQKGEKASDEQQQAVAQAEQQFLKNQQEYQRKTEELTQLAEEEEQVRLQLVPVAERLAAARQAGQVAYQAQLERWQWRVAAIKVSLLVPLIVVAGWLFRLYRTSLYAPLVYALGLAVGAKAFRVAHEYFPALYFKYLIIGSSLIATLWLLFKLLQMLARPQTSWLLKQYREAYEAFLCPVCDFPIRRGPLKYLSWTKRTIKRLPMPTAASGNEPEVAYTCPMCATRLYEECTHCHGIRTSLLPACSHCGDVKEVVA